MNVIDLKSSEQNLQSMKHKIEKFDVSVQLVWKFCFNNVRKMHFEEIALKFIQLPMYMYGELLYCYIVIFVQLLS